MSDELRDFLASWDWDLSIVLPISVAALLYALGLAKLSRKAGGRALPSRGRVACFYLGLALAWLALLSPIDSYSELFFFLHMIEHLLLVLGAVPLVLLANPLAVLLWGLPTALRTAVSWLLIPGGLPRRVSEWLTQPLVACSLFVGAIGIWHVPALYDLAQGRTGTHELEHLIFMLTAALFWWPVIQPAGRRRLSFGHGIAYLFLPFFESNLIGALLTFATAPVYQWYVDAERLWGMSAHQDQQIAGLIMWVPGGLYYLIPMLIMLRRALVQEERRQEMDEREAARKS